MNVIIIIIIGAWIFVAIEALVVVMTQEEKVGYDMRQTIADRYVCKNDEQDLSPMTSVHNAW